MTIQHLIPIMFLAAFCTVSAQTNNSEAFRSHRNQDDFAPIHAHQAELSLACGAAMTNILKDIAKLSPEYPQLSEIDSASIEAWGSTNAPTYQLIYKKDVHFGALTPSITRDVTNTVGYITNHADNADSYIPSIKKVIDERGMDLEIILADAENEQVSKSNGKYYGLLKVNNSPKFVLLYNLSLHAPDGRLEKSLSAIFETNVTLLKSNLRNILGVNPEQEKRDLLAPVMTNLLIKLKEIGPQYPLLSNINSATIENKGTNYLYQHLRFWNNAGATCETNMLAEEGAFNRIKPVVEQGGFALDIYVLSRDEPFGFASNGVDLIREDGQSKVVLAHTWYWNGRDMLHADSSKAITSTLGAVDKIIRDQGSSLRKALDNVISF